MKVCLGRWAGGGGGGGGGNLNYKTKMADTPIYVKILQNLLQNQ